MRADYFRRRRKRPSRDGQFPRATVAPEDTPMIDLLHAAMAGNLCGHSRRDLPATARPRSEEPRSPIPGRRLPLADGLKRGVAALLLRRRYNAGRRSAFLTLRGATSALLRGNFRC
jgi:hypothetical protein